MVYNHTAEGNHLGPTLSFKGIDNESYYRTRRGGPGALLRHHRHRQQRQRQPPGRAGTDHGLAALLGQRHARRRLPVRPGDDTDPPGRRRRPAQRVLDLDRSGSAARSDQDDRRAVGHRGLSGRRLPRRLVGVERQVPRRRPRLLARGRRHVGHGGPTAARQPGRLRGVPSSAGGERQLRHRARRVHPGRPDRVRPQAQRGQRGGQCRRRIRQQVVQRRGRGPDGQRRGQPAPRPSAAQLPGVVAARGRRTDDLGWGRARSDPGWQQQRLLPGRRDLLVRLGRRGRRAPRLHSSVDPAAPGRARAAPDLGSDRRERAEPGRGWRSCARTPSRSATTTGPTRELGR